MLITIFYLVLALLIIIKAGILIYFTKRILKRETKAIILKQDLDDEIIKINPNEKSFKHKKKKYLVPNKEKGFVMIGRKKYCFYDEDNPEPKNVYQQNTPLMSAKAFYEVVNTDVLTKLNRATSAFSGFDFKTVLLGGGVLVILYILFM